MHQWPSAFDLSIIGNISDVETKNKWTVKGVQKLLHMFYLKMVYPHYIKLSFLFVFGV